MAATTTRISCYFTIRSIEVQETGNGAHITLLGYCVLCAYSTSLYCYLAPAEKGHCFMYVRYYSRRRDSVSETSLLIRRGGD